jgi:hypothetical protein
MFRRFAATCLVWLLASSVVLADGVRRVAREEGGSTREEVLTDAAIIALIIAGSIALYKARGRPCACPSDTMKNGRACGNVSAYVRPGGAKPLCFAGDVTADMIKAYRANKAIPALY